MVSRRVFTPVRRLAAAGTLALAASVLVLGVAPASASPATPAFAALGKARYVVTFHDGVDPQAMGSAMAGQGITVVRLYGTLFSGVAADMTPEQAAAIAADPQVALVEADVQVRASSTQSGAGWALDRIDQSSPAPDAAFSYPPSAGSGVAVYIVDTGLNVGSTIKNLQHLDLLGRIAPGYSWIEDGWGTDDCSGHGTHVAGTIAGTTYGVAKAATVIPARVLECNGWGKMSDVVAALDWIHASRDRSKPTIVNLSLSGPATTTLDNAVTRLFDSGVTVVAAAGNDGIDACQQSPARSAASIAVGASNSSDYRDFSSNFGACVDLFAPGTYIESAWIGGTDARSVSGGTSSSAALVSGAAALILGENPALSPTQVRDRLFSTATSGIILNPGEGSPNRLLRVS